MYWKTRVSLLSPCFVFLLTPHQLDTLDPTSTPSTLLSPTYIPQKMDFHWSHPVLIGIVVIMFIMSYFYADHLEPFIHQVSLLHSTPSDTTPSRDTIDSLSSIETTSSVEPFTNYTTCARKPPKGILKDIFDTYDIYQTRGDQWDIFLPCTYTHVERELREMPVSRLTGGVVSPTTPTTSTSSVMPSTRPSAELQTQQSLLLTPNSGQRRAIFAVDGCDRLVSKNRLWQALVDAYGRDHARTLMPPTYILADPEDLKRFLQQFDPQAMYICKKNVQRKKGLLMTNNMDDILRCHTQGYKIIQEYITNVHTVHSHKLNLRLYVLIVCNANGGPKRAYVHTQGKCLYTAKPYSPDTLMDETSQITSLDTSAALYEGSNALPLTLDDLRQHWYNERIDYDRVMGQVHRALREVVHAVLPGMCQASKFNNHIRFQLFGADVLLRGDTLEPYVLELNKGPSMKPVNQADYGVKRGVLEDVFKKVGVYANHTPSSLTVEGANGNAFREL